MTKETPSNPKENETPKRDWPTREEFQKAFEEGAKRRANNPNRYKLRHAMGTMGRVIVINT